MKMMHLLIAVSAVFVVVIACNKEHSLDNAVELNANKKKGLNEQQAKDTCLLRNGKDSCFKLPMPSDTTQNGGGKDSSDNGGYGPIDTIYNGGHNDTTYYPGGWKDSCIKRNGMDTCFKRPISSDTLVKNTNN